MPSGRVLLLGDSLRVAYQGRVAAELGQDGLTVSGPEGSCGDCAAMAEAVADWLAEFEPDICCFGCAPLPREALAWSAAGNGDGRDEISLGSMSRYERDLMRVAESIRRFCGRQTVFATMAPVHAGRFRANGNGAGDGGEILNRAIAQYNQFAMGLMGELNVAVADVHHGLSRFADECLAADGVGLTERGIVVAGEAIARGVYGVVHA